MALRAVDTDLYLFKGMSLLDLAVVSECLSFVQTECCTQVCSCPEIDLRFLSSLDLALVLHFVCLDPVECALPSSILFESVFTQAIEYRFYGDLSPTQFETRWGQIKFIFAVMSFGLLPTFVRDFVDWTPQKCRFP